jgi:hypothetical protein
MDERIKELILRTDAWCEQNFPANWTDDVDQYLPLWNAKFAELIVRECANICFSEAAGHNMAFGEHCGVVIKEHFGVEQ